jgi:hypothetical protein
LPGLLALIVLVGCSGSHGTSDQGAPDAGAEGGDGGVPCTMRWSGDVNGAASCHVGIAALPNFVDVTIFGDDPRSNQLNFMRTSFDAQTTYGTADVGLSGSCESFKFGTKTYQVVDHVCAVLAEAGVILKLTSFRAPKDVSDLGEAHGSADLHAPEYDRTKCNGGDPPSCGLGPGSIDIHVDF